MSRFPSRRIVITGASSGIGAATAIAFARSGATLVLGARGQAGLDDVVARCSAAGGDARARVVDVTDAEAVAAFAADARDVLGGIDLWFSCVGVGVLGRFEDVPLADHRRVLEANLVGHVNDAHAVLPIFLAQDHGIWVNMISVGGYVATPFAAAYSASKFGLRGFSQALRGELSNKPRIHVCDVYPTFVDTPAVGHAGNYTGARLTLPPGALAPATVARAVVRLARRPRASTFVGAPGLAFRLGQFLMPNLLASVLSRLLDRWTRTAPPGATTQETLFAPPKNASGSDGGRRDPHVRRLIAAGALATAAAVAVGVSLMSGSGRKRA